MTDDPSVSFWIEGLKQGDEESAGKLWKRYFEMLVTLARSKLGSVPRRVADEEDVALSVFRCLCDSAERGRLPELSDRDDLWRLLVTMTVNKVIDQKRRQAGQRRGGGRVRGESLFAPRGPDRDRAPGLAQLVDDAPPPVVLLMLDELRSELFDALHDDVLRSVAEWKLEGYTNAEIAERLGLTTRSIERKLQRIRDHWSPGWQE